MTSKVIYRPGGRALEYGRLAVNLYTDSCPHHCDYCYVPGVRHMSRADWLKLECKPRAGVLMNMEKDLLRLKKRGEGGQVFLCFTCDPYPNGVDTTVTREAIQLIHDNGFGVQLLTKGGMRAARDFDLLGSQDAFGASLTFDTPADSNDWEPGAEFPANRAAALAAAYDRGIPTWVSLEPVINPKATLHLISMTHHFVDYYKVGTWNHDARAKEIDWPKFGRDAANLLDSLGRPYYLKADLRARMEAKP